MACKGRKEREMENLSRDKRSDVGASLSEGQAGEEDDGAWREQVGEASIIGRRKGQQPLVFAVPGAALLSLLFARGLVGHADHESCRSKSISLLTFPSHHKSIGRETVG
jgi:hypothetical protein